LPIGAMGDALRRVETRAFGLLLDELLDCCPVDETAPALRALATACTQPDVAARPDMDAVCAELTRVTTLA
jgi:hypothetical protein